MHFYKYRRYIQVLNRQSIQYANVPIGFTRQTGKQASLPSPLGRVAGGRQGRRGSLPPCFTCAFPRKPRPKNLFRQPFGLPPAPKEKSGEKRIKTSNTNLGKLVFVDFRTRSDFAVGEAFMPPGYAVRFRRNAQKNETLYRREA